MEMGEKHPKNVAYDLRLPLYIIGFFLHAANLRHGANGFSSFPKEGMLRIFLPEKSDGFGRERTRNLGYQRPAC
jgi:hypothetical protein